jgi:hypothetical protein
MTETTDTGSVRITLADIYAQGQETQKRVTVVEQKVDDLTVVNRRLAKHSERIDALENDVARAQVVHTELGGRIDRLSDKVSAQTPLSWPQRVAVAGSGLGLIATAITLVAIFSKLGS